MQISALTHIGTKRQTQQDAILVNGNLLTDGMLTLENQEVVTCFVADGVAGSTDGAFASRYILGQISEIVFDDDWMLNVSKLQKINQRLNRLNAENGANSASTLCGIIYNGKDLQIFQTGDCELYLLRGDHFIPLASVHNESVENIKKKYPGISLEQAYEKANNTITSFFGSQTPHLRFDLDWQRRIKLPAVNGVQPNDKIIICSDGLFKSISKGELLTIIEEHGDKHKMLVTILKKSKNNGAIDNVSMVMIEDF